MVQKFIVTLLLLLSAAAVQSAGLNKTEQKKFIDEMVAEHDFDKKQLETLFSKVKLLDRTLEAIARPAEKSKEWWQYRKIFVTPERINKGVAFWKENRAMLVAIEKQYGVPRNIIVAIIGVETYYGKHKGKYRVIDSLATLAFNYPKRAAFFRGELEHFLIFTREQKMDPFSLIGSYAGAMGMPQFMPSSYQTYAVDFDRDGQINIWENKGDIFASVANYFKRHGWKTGEPVATLAWLKKGAQIQTFLDKGLKPSIPLAEIKTAGVSLNRKIEENPLASLYAYKQEKSTDYWVLLQNFYTITRYNHSPLYGMAVYQLSEALKEAYIKDAISK